MQFFQFSWSLLTLSTISYLSRSQPQPPPCGVIGNSNLLCILLPRVNASFDIYPSTTGPISQQIQLYSDVLYNVLSYTINFTPRGADCISPTLSFDMWQHDHYRRDREQIIIIYEDNSNTTCGTAQDCSFLACLDEESLPDIINITMDTTYTIHIITMDDIDGFCSDTGQRFEGLNTTVSANLTLNCDQSSTSLPPVIPSDTTLNIITPIPLTASFDIYPSINGPVSQQIELYSNVQNQALNYTINFTPRGADCISPSISFGMWQIDNDDDKRWDEQIIIIYQDNSNTTCGTNDDCSFLACLDEESLPDTINIAMDTTYTIHIITGDSIDDLCSDYPGQRFEGLGSTVSANLTVDCVVVPTPQPTAITASPTVSPTTDSELIVSISDNYKENDSTIIAFAVSGIIQIVIAIITLWLVSGYFIRFRREVIRERIIMYSVIGNVLLAFVEGCIRTFVLTNVFIAGDQTILKFRCDYVFWYRIYILQLGQVLIYIYLLSRLKSFKIFQTAMYYFLLFFISFITLFTTVILPWYSIPIICYGNGNNPQLMICMDSTPSDVGIYEEYVIFLSVNAVAHFVLLVIFLYQLYQSYTEYGCGTLKRILILGVFVVLLNLSEFIYFCITEETFYIIRFIVYSIVIMLSFNICSINEESDARWCCWCWIKENIGLI